MQPIHVLLIDDEKDYCDSLKTNARISGILIADFQSLDEGLKELEKELKYKAIILDAKCMVDKSQSVDNFDFLPVALDRLKVFEQQYNLHLPFVVNTGYIGEKELSMVKRQIDERKGKIFSKTDTKDDLFNYLISEINILEITKFEKDFEKVIQVFEKGYLPNNMRNDLFKVFQKKDSSNPTDIKDNLSTIRRILDEIFSKISSSKPFVLPSAKNTFNKKVKHLSGNIQESPVGSGNYIPSTNKYQASTIEFLSTAIYRISSDFGSHAVPTISARNQPMPTSMTVNSLVYAIMEIILWFTELMDNE